MTPEPWLAGHCSGPSPLRVGKLLKGAVAQGVQAEAEVAEVLVEDLNVRVGMQGPWRTGAWDTLAVSC